LKKGQPHRDLNLLSNIKHCAETLAFVTGKHFNAGAVEQTKEWGPALAMECEKWKLKHIENVIFYMGLGSCSYF